jgi:hypothetical protein
MGNARILVRMKRAFFISAVVMTVYLGGYCAYRASNTEVWEVDGISYVIFGSRLSYYVFRPLTYIDGGLTGMRFHIGPHQRTNESSR